MDRKHGPKLILWALRGLVAAWIPQVVSRGGGGEKERATWGTARIEVHQTALQEKASVWFLHGLGGILSFLQLGNPVWSPSALRRDRTVDP